MTISLAAGSRRTPVGPVRFAVEDGGAVVALAFDDRWEAVSRHLDRHHGAAKLGGAREVAFVGDALDAYLAGDLGALDALRVSPGGTDFQRRVWTALRAIPAGTTASYAELARAVGAPRAVRAVGAANGANPVSIIVPCHRVIGSDGSLTGYGGGMERKAWLLAHEGRAATKVG
jgi:O-6-methylguanine DNA methyltransferase